MSFLSRDWLLEKNTYGNTNPAEYRSYAQKLIESAPIYSSVDEETNKRLYELDGYIADINMNEILSHIKDGTLDSWITTWRGEVFKKIHSIKNYMKQDFYCFFEYGGKDEDYNRNTRYNSMCIL